MPRLIEVRPLDSYGLYAKFDDGVDGIADLSEFAGSGVFVLWNDYENFRKARIGPSGELAWSEDVEMCPDAVYLRITGKSPEDLFPKLRELRQHAGN